MKKHYNYIIILFLVGLSYQTIAQETLQGRVLDAKSLTPLPYPTVILNDTVVIETDGSGFYSATLDRIESIMVSYIGYDTLYTLITLPVSNNTLKFDVKLKEVSSLLGTVVVSGTNYSKSILDEPTSIEVIKPDFIQNNNITSLDKVIERVPGIQVQDGQASIRSSGFSQGTGSRVGLIVDGMPLLGGDNSGIQWNFIPIENIEQVEVIKGAASVLYGSAAMNGVINVRTAMPTSEPYTNITLYSGISDSPKKKYRQWWTNTSERPSNYGLFAAHRQKFGKLDLVLGGNYHKSIGHIQGINEDRIRINGKARYRVNDKLNFTLDANLMSYSLPTYLSWEDGDTNILKPLRTIDLDEYKNYSIGLTTVYYSKYQFKHTLRGRFYGSTFTSGTGETYPVAMTFLEYQTQKNFGKQFILTAGVSNQIYAANSLNFGTDSLGVAPVFAASITSIYAQGDFNAFNKRLNVIGGVRWEIIDAGIEDYPRLPPIFRLSSTFKINPKNILRMNAGQGYRFPSLYERFVDLVYQEFYIEPINQTLRFGIQPNPNLLPEYGWSAEIGYKRVLNIREWNGYFDVAAFAMRYRDMIYLTLDYHKDLGREFVWNDLLDDIDPLGYRFINIDNTLVSGVEVGANLNGQVGKLPFKLWAGYTYTYPGNLDMIKENDESYFSNFINAFILSDDEEAIINSMLTYRSTHVARVDLEVYFKSFTFGFSTIMDGYMHNIDPLLEGRSKWSEVIRLLGGEVLPGVIDFRAANPNNNWAFDAKLAYKINDRHQLNFIVSNILNTTYAVRPGRINPLRNFNLKYSFTL